MKGYTVQIDKRLGKQLTPEFVRANNKALTAALSFPVVLIGAGFRGGFNPHVDPAEAIIAKECRALSSSNTRHESFQEAFGKSSNITFLVTLGGGVKDQIRVVATLYTADQILYVLSLVVRDNGEYVEISGTEHP